jgi:hypothetical protein
MPQRDDEVIGVATDRWSSRYVTSGMIVFSVLAFGILYALRLDGFPVAATAVSLITLLLAWRQWNYGVFVYKTKIVTKSALSSRTYVIEDVDSIKLADSAMSHCAWIMLKNGEMYQLRVVVPRWSSTSMERFRNRLCQEDFDNMLALLNQVGLNVVQ